MRIRAKFLCKEVNYYEDGASVKLEAVYDDNPESENGKFFKYTPGGEIDLHVLNHETADAFRAGREYFVDFEPV